MRNQSSTEELTVSDLAAKATDSAKQAAAGINEGVSREFSNFIADMEKLFKGTSALTGEDLELAKNMFNERVSDAKKSMESYSEIVSEQVRKSSALTNEYVHEQPWKVIGAVAAVSFLLGMLSNRRG